MTYTLGNNDKVFKWQQFYYDAWRTWGTYYNQAYRDLRAYAGDNWTNLEKTKLERQNRMVLELNKIRRVVNLYSGYERENRTQTVAGPVEGSDDETADLFSDVMYYTYNKGNADYIISEAFEPVVPVVVRLPPSVINLPSLFTPVPPFALVIIPETEDADI